MSRKEREVRLNIKTLADSALTLKIGDTVVWRNDGAETVALFFPDSRLFGRHQMKVKARNMVRARVQRTAPVLTVCPYAAFFTRKERYAEGSSPIIIVQP